MRSRPQQSARCLARNRQHRGLSAALELGNLAELDRTLRVLLVKRGVSPDESDAYLTRLLDQMKTTFPDALVPEWQPLVDAIQLPDANDRHVVAAALAGRADVIVTDNLADFPTAALPAPLTRQSLDDFLLESLGLYPGQVMSAIRSVASRTGKYGPTMTVDNIATYLQAHGTPGFGKQLLMLLNLG